MVTINKDEVFYDSVKASQFRKHFDFVWYFSKFISFFCIFCYIVGVSEYELTNLLVGLMQVRVSN
jgi:hypothetical protein